MRYLLIICVLIGTLSSQQPSDTKSSSSVRVYVIDKDSWQASGGFVASQNGAVGSYHEGVRPINTEQIKSLHQACPSVTITAAKDTADFIVVWETKTWSQTAWSGHQNEYVVYGKNGDVIYTGAAHKISNAAKDICKSVMPKAQPKNIRIIDINRAPCTL